ncbi:MAG TPA: AarF/ABC1/UbiB kinase family protein [Polyangiaceae bacterium]|nr:AarF/ABC1/UbiB kinase family protein [Polyangiaceae bacterium]
MVSIVHAARDIGRVRDISGVLARYGFGEVLGRMGFGPKRSEQPDASTAADAWAPRLRLALEELGPSFIKLGQIMSTRADVLPPELIAELTKLQDDVPPVSFAEIKEQVERSLGAELDEVYADFDERPLAAASIAQVHRAKLRTDEGLMDVVVKVQRPGIGETISSDVGILHTFAALLERAVPESRIYSPTGLVHQFDHAITSELDFVTEAENAVRFAQNFQGYRNVKFPKVYRQATSKQVITLEYLDGKKIFDAVAAGHSGKKLARLAMDILVKQVFEDGFFHADPHPGNVLILGPVDDPTFAMFDLGMVGRLSPRMRDLAVDLMVCAVRRDYEGIADALYAIGTPTKKIDMRAYRAEVALLAEKYLGKQLKDIEMSSLIRDLVQGSMKFGIEVPTDFVLVGKALMTTEGVGKALLPDLDVFEEARPLFVELMKKRYSPERLGNELIRRLERLSGATSNLPEQMRDVLDDLRFGRLTVRTSDADAGSASDRLGRRIYSGLVGSSLVLSGAWALTARQPYASAALFVCAAIWLSGHTVRDAIKAWTRR